jgi:hypothetical protein
MAADHFDYSRTHGDDDIQAVVPIFFAESGYDASFGVFVCARSINAFNIELHLVIGVGRKHRKQALGYQGASRMSQTHFVNDQYGLSGRHGACRCLWPKRRP